MFYYFSLSGELPDSPGEEWFSWIRLSQKRVHEETFVFFGGEKTWHVIGDSCCLGMLGAGKGILCNSNYVCFLRIFFVLSKAPNTYIQNPPQKHCGGALRGST